MSNTTTTASKPATPLTGKFTAASRASIAKLQPAPAVSAPATTKFAVDVQLAGSAAYQAGVVVRYFADESAAKAMAAGINSGNLAVVGASKVAWYQARKPRNARVIPAFAIPVGKSAADVLAAKANASKRASKRGAAATIAKANGAPSAVALLGNASASAAKPSDVAAAAAIVNG